MPPYRAPKPLPTDDDLYLDWPEVIHRTTLSRTTIHRLMRQNKFPQSVRLSPGRTGWLKKDVMAWIEAKAQLHV
jgi:prophage regulatory protein